MTSTTTVPAYRTFALEVASVDRLSPTFVRVGLTGPDLTSFHDGGLLGTRDTRVKLIVPDDPAAPPTATVDVENPFWYREWLALEPAVRGHLRTYTARRLRAVPDGRSPALDVDFVLHLNSSGHGGPATTWAAQARPGDRLTLLGPNAAHPEPGGAEWRPPRPAPDETQQVLLVGDETALPAVGAILEALPDEYVGDAIVELPCMEDAQALRTPPGVQVTYLPRNGKPRGVATMRALEQLLSRPLTQPLVNAAARGAFDADPDVLWETPDSEPDRHAGCYAWVAGEAAVVREVRRALVGVHGLARRQVAFMGYWREGRAEA